MVGKVTGQHDSSITYGFNAQTEEYVDLIQAGIVDPAKVVRTALQDASSVAGLLVTTEAMIADAPKKDSAAAPEMPGGGRYGRHGLLSRPYRHVEWMLSRLPPRERRGSSQDGPLFVADDRTRSGAGRLNVVARTDLADMNP